MQATKGSPTASDPSRMVPDLVELRKITCPTPRRDGSRSGSSAAAILSPGDGGGGGGGGGDDDDEKRLPRPGGGPSEARIDPPHDLAGRIPLQQEGAQRPARRSGRGSMFSQSARESSFLGLRAGSKPTAGGLVAFLCAASPRHRVHLAFLLGEEDLPTFQTAPMMIVGDKSARDGREPKK
jgi:hypothetical protein